MQWCYQKKEAGPLPWAEQDRSVKAGSVRGVESVEEDEGSLQCVVRAEQAMVRSQVNWIGHNWIGKLDWPRLIGQNWF